MKKKSVMIPDTATVDLILKKEQYKKRYWRTLRSTIYSLLVVAAIAVLVATIWMPVLRIYGSSMTPTLTEGEIVLSIKGSDFDRGDIVALYVGNKLLVKRIIAGPGQWVNIDADGTIYVDGEELKEPYLSEKAYGDVTIELPYQVPEDRYFVMGDHRSTSADSRNTAIGCIAEEQIVGRILVCVWPFSNFGLVEK
ncbi:MAG: signal peptidase I [Lachnospiraceae bacterium]